MIEHCDDQFEGEYLASLPPGSYGSRKRRDVQIPRSIASQS